MNENANVTNIDYCHQMNLIAKHIRGEINLSNDVLWDYIYTCFGALNQIERLKTNEQTLRKFFTLSFNERSVSLQKKIPSRKYDRYGNETILKDKNGNVIYKNITIVQKVFDVAITPNSELSSKDFYRVKNIFVDN